MEIFNNRQRSGYDEIVSYGPLYYKEIREMDAIWRFGGATLDIMANGLEDLMANQFIDHCGLEMIKRLEKWFSLQVDSSKKIEDRRKTVKLARNGGDKLRGSLIKSMFKTYTGCTKNPIVRMTTYLYIESSMASDITIYMSDLIDQLEKMKPATLKMVIVLTIEADIRISKTVSHTVFGYAVAGIYPEIGTIGVCSTDEVVTDPEVSNYIFQMNQSSETAKCGTVPRIGTAGSYLSDPIGIHSDTSSSQYNHSQASADAVPMSGTLGSYIESGASIGIISNASVSTYKQSGEGEEDTDVE